jgi:hypothetical protein
MCECFFPSKLKGAHDFEIFFYISELSADSLHQRLVIYFNWLVSFAKNPTTQNAIRVIRKVRGTQHQNPEFGHTQGEIQKKTCKKEH